MKDWYSTIYKACIWVSLITFLIGYFTQSETSLGAFIAGYSVLILGITLILVIVFANVLRVTGGASLWQTIYTLVTTSGPFILILGVVAVMLYLLIFYKQRIIDGHVAPGFNTFSGIVSVLLFVEMFILYNSISSERFEATGKLPRVTSALSYLLNVLTVISTVILFTILRNYSTDGFSLRI
jgi:hypothetical protein